MGNQVNNSTPQVRKLITIPDIRPNKIQIPTYKVIDGHEIRFHVLFCCAQPNGLNEGALLARGLGKSS